MDEQRHDDQLEPTYNRSVPIYDAFLKTCREQWTTEKGVEKGSGISELMVRHDIYIYIYIYIYIHTHMNTKKKI